MEFLDKTIIILFFVAVAAGVVLFPGFLAIWFKGLRGKKINKKLIIATIIAGLFFIGPIITAIFFSTIVESHGREEVLSFIREKTSYEIIIDGQKVPNPASFIHELRKIRPFMGHHSHPTKKIPIEIFKSNQKLTLILSQDSDYNNEYWVFYPKYRHTRLNEIGRIQTAIPINL